MTKDFRLNARLGTSMPPGPLGFYKSIHCILTASFPCSHICCCRDSGVEALKLTSAQLPWQLISFFFFFFGSSSPLGMNDKKFLSSFFNPKIAPNQRILALVISKHFVASDIPQRYNNFFRTLKWWEPFQIAWEKNIVIFSHHCYSSLSSVLLSFLLTLSVSETLYLDKLCLLLSVSNYMWVTRDINHVYLLALYF